MLRKPVFYGWAIVAAAFFTLLITVGVPFYGMPFFYDHFLKEFGWNRAEATSGIALATILVQPVAGLLVHRFSPRRLIVAGSLALSASLVSFGMGTGSLFVYYGSWILFMIGYVFAGPLAAQILLTNWFSKRRGIAIGCAYLGLGIGGAISQRFVALPLIAALGWRSALVAIGLSVLLVIPLALFIIRDHPQDKGLKIDGAGTDGPEAPVAALSFREVLASRGFWLLGLGSACSIGAIGSINQHMKLLFLDAGLSSASVAETTFWILTASLVGRLVMGWLADRFSKKWILLSAFALVAAPIPLLHSLDQPGIPLIFAICFGFGLGADYMLIPLLAAALFGSRSLARVMGIILPMDSIAQTCFPFLLGALRDKTGDYSLGLAVVFLIAITGAVAAVLLPGKTKPVRSQKLVTVP